MLKKRQIFYFDQDSSGQTKIHEDRIVQARVIAVAEKVVRAEIFGVETSILARDLSLTGWVMPGAIPGRGTHFGTYSERRWRFP